MGSRLRIFLTKEQDRELFDLRTAKVPQKVKDRAEVIRLNADGWYVEKIAAHFDWGEQTVRLVLNKWEKCLKEEARTYNSKQLAEKLDKERGIKVSTNTVRRGLKKKGVRWKRIRISHQAKQDPVNRASKLFRYGYVRTGCGTWRNRPKVFR